MVFIDPETVPAEVSGAVAMYGAVDFIYGTANHEDASWPVMELNLRAPYIVGFDNHPQAAKRLHAIFADQIARTARPLSNSLPIQSDLR